MDDAAGDRLSPGAFESRHSPVLQKLERSGPLGIPLANRPAFCCVQAGIGKKKKKQAPFHKRL
jgi:hypothetical protein